MELGKLTVEFLQPMDDDIIRLLSPMDYKFQLRNILHKLVEGFF